jgi:hypothetical protein
VCSLAQAPRRKALLTRTLADISSRLGFRLAAHGCLEYACFRVGVQMLRDKLLLSIVAVIGLMAVSQSAGDGSGC